MMRKQPKQQRSQALVNAIKEACRQILFREVDVVLSTTELARLSGVAVGSLYQYFPNVESVVASVYEALALEQVRGQRHYAINELSELSLRDGLSQIILASVGFHRLMLELNPDFHRQYHECFNLNESFNLIAEDGRGTNWILTKLIQSEIPSNEDIDPEFMAGWIIHVVKTSINVAVEKSPDTVFENTFERRLLNMCMGLLNKSRG